MNLAEPPATAFAAPRIAEEILATMREPFAVLDERRRLIAASPAFFLRFGLERDASIGRSIHELGEGEWDTPGARELFEELVPRRDSVDGYSLEVRTKAGGPGRVEVSVRPIREGRNELRALLVSFVDPAVLEDAAAADLTRRVRQRGGDLVLVLDGDRLDVVAVEGAVRELTGAMARELVGTPFESLLHEPELERLRSELRALIAGEPHLRTTFRIRHRSLRTLWVEAICHSTRAPDGRTLVHLVVRDVSERKRAEDALRWLGRQTKLILDSAADGIFGVDPAGNLTFVNPAAARALGYRVPELLGRSYTLLVEGAEEPVGATLEDGLARILVEGVLRSADGSDYPAEISCSAAREHGHVTGAVVTFRGIAERKRAEAAALRAEWLAGVGETTLAVRHEINNPLTTLLAEARLLEMGGNTPEEEREMIASICAEARRIGDVIRRLAETQDEPRVRFDGTQRMLDLS